MMCLMSSNTFGSAPGSDTTTNPSLTPPANIYETPPASNETSSRASPTSDSDASASPTMILPPRLCDPDVELNLKSTNNSTCVDSTLASDSPTKGWRRILVNLAADDAKPEWSIQFVSPDGLQFENHAELLEHLQKHRIDPLQLSFLNSDKCVENQLKFIVKVRLCTMRQNILDIRKKKGRKRSRDSQRRVSTTSRRSTASGDGLAPTELGIAIMESNLADITEEPEANSHNESRLLVQDIIEDIIPSPEKNPDAFNVDQRGCAIKQRRISQSSAKRRISIDLDNHETNCSPPALSLEPCGDDSDERLWSDVTMGKEGELSVESEEEIVSYRSNDIDLIEEAFHSVKSIRSSVPIVDIFKDTPLDKFVCSVCSHPYSTKNDFTMNFGCQVMSIVCNNCSWWTERRFSTKDCPFPS